MSATIEAPIEAPPVVPLYLTMDELAQRLRCSKSSAQELIYSGRIRSIKVGRLRRIPIAAVVSFEDAGGDAGSSEE